MPAVCFAHISLGTEEGCHAGIRRTYCKIEVLYSTFKALSSLVVTMKVMIDITRKKWLYITRTNFELTQWFLVIITDLLVYESKFDTIEMTQPEMVAIVVCQTT